MSESTAAEYDFLTRRIAEWEEIYDRDEHGRERDIRDDLLALHRRQAEIQTETVFGLRRQVSGNGNGKIIINRLQEKVEEFEDRLFKALDKFLDKAGDKLVAEMRRVRHEQK